MIRKAYFIFTIMIISLAISCNQGSFTEKISKKYSFHDAGGQYRDIIKDIDVGLFSDSIHLNYIKSNIYSNVIRYNYNKDFIIAVQKPDKEGHIKAIAFELEYLYTEDVSKMIADSLVKYDSYFKKIFSREFNYWIICIRQDSLYGPLSEEEFIKAKKELTVPMAIELRGI